jgi:agmatine deiminase
MATAIQMTKRSTPSAAGFRMPAEWEPHEATWLAWPHHTADWPGKFAAVPWVYSEIVRHLHVSERVRIVVNDLAGEKRARQVLSKVPVDLRQIDFYRFPTDRVWVRDSGPIFVVDNTGQVAITNWKFNAWAKYNNWTRDNRLPQRIASALKLPCWRPSVNARAVVLEGGSIEVNGRGLLLTTEECLLDTVQARNPGLAHCDIEAALQDYLGVTKVLWLGRGIMGDDTHGHVDDLARFVAEDTVVAVTEKDAADPNYAPLQDNLRRLKNMTGTNGKPLDVIPLPMPQPVCFAGRRLPASYANFYTANDRVLVPTFNDPQDRIALGILADLFPGRRVVGIHAVDLVWGLGTLHCLTQQQPRGRGQGPGARGQRAARGE